MKKASSTYNLAVCFPDIASEWHPTKNGDLIPKAITPGSGNKYWWRCPKCEHEYQARSNDRTGVHKSGCPACSGRIATSENNLKVCSPEITKEWNYQQNGNLKPENVTPYSSYSLWWVCIKCSHEWQAPVRNRTKNQTGCPACIGKVATPEYNLAVCFPKVAAEWDYKKNSDSRPEQVMPNAALKPWWICFKCEHRYQARLSDRTSKNSGCPKCKRQKLSGENNYNWQGGKSFEPYTSDFTSILKIKIRERDNFTCQLCGMTEEESLIKDKRVLAINHIDFNKQNCNEWNLNTLCLRCNSKINFNRKYYTKLFQEQLFNRTLEAALAV